MIGEALALNTTLTAPSARLTQAPALLLRPSYPLDATTSPPPSEGCGSAYISVPNHPLPPNLSRSPTTLPLRPCQTPPLSPSQVCLPSPLPPLQSSLCNPSPLPSPPGISRRSQPLPLSSSFTPAAPDSAAAGVTPRLSPTAQSDGGDGDEGAAGRLGRRPKHVSRFLFGSPGRAYAVKLRSN